MQWRRTLRQIHGWCGTEAGATTLVLCAVVLSLGATWWHLDRSERLRTDAFTSLIATSVAHDLARGLDQLDLVLQTITGGRQSPADRTLSEAERNSLLSERTPRDRNIAFVDVLDVNGYVQATTRQVRDPSNWASRDYFYQQKDNLTDRIYIGRPFEPSREGFLRFPISRRVTDDSGRFAGVVVAGLRLGYLRDLIAGLDLGPDVSVTILREDGVVLMRVPFDPREIGSSEDAIPAFAAFVRSGATPATVAGIGGAERQVVFHRAGSFPLVVSVSSARASHGPGVWLLGTAVVILGGLALLARRLRHATQQRGAAERESREKSRFLTMLSHDLRTSLHSVLGRSDQLLHDTALPPVLVGPVSRIAHAGKHMRDVLNIVLDYARVEARGPVPQRRWVELKPLIAYCMDVIEPAARARNLQTRVTMAPGAPTAFITDPVQLQQILLNLLSNAVKYTPQGSVEVRVAGTADDLIIEVADTGIGIPEGQRHHLFMEYERFGTERTGIEGTGLGLAIAQRLTSRLGGKIGHRDNSGGGSIFWLRLPQGVADKPDDEPAQASAEAVPRLRVLVVDDSDINREISVANLRHAGHMVREAHDGGDAVRLAAACDFDVVLMDMRMAGMDGLEATRQIRALEGPRGKVPIIAVTANALDQQAEACRRAGMSAHLAKPFTRTELLDVVAREARRPASAMVDATLSELTAELGEEGVERQLDCLALRLEAMLRKLDEPASPNQLADLAHELIGSAGALGFSRLAAAASRFEASITSGRADPAELRRNTTEALEELRRRRSLEALLAG